MRTAAATPSSAPLSANIAPDTTAVSGACLLSSQIAATRLARTAPAAIMPLPRFFIRLNAAITPVSATIVPASALSAAVTTASFPIVATLFASATRPFRPESPSATPRTSTQPLNASAMVFIHFVACSSCSPGTSASFASAIATRSMAPATRIKLPAPVLENFSANLFTTLRLPLARLRAPMQAVIIRAMLASALNPCFNSAGCSCPNFFTTL